MIRFACPGCDSTFSVGDEKAGKTGKCPKCQTQFLIPDSPGPAAAVDTFVPPAPPPTRPAPPRQPEPEAVEIAPCPGCGSRLSVDPADVGLDVECPTCSRVYKGVQPGADKRAGSKSSFGGGSSVSSALEGVGKKAARADDRPSQRRVAEVEDDEEDDEEEERPSRRKSRGGRSRGRRGTVVIRRFGVVSTGKIMGLLYAILSLFVAIPYGLILILAGAAGGGGPGGGGAGGAIAGVGVCLVFGLPIFYGVVGFLGGMLTAAVYNALAAWVGGIDMELE